MTDQERADAIAELQDLARQEQRLEKLWDDIVLAAMELDFLE